MKILTLNTHSLQEENMNEKREQFVSFVKDTQPDVIALQEVNQLMSAQLYTGDTFGLRFHPEGSELKEGNHALLVAKMLREAGLHYEWSWLPMKIGYDKYDEGLALFSRKPILESADLLASRIDEYTDFRTRRILGIRNEDGWFYSIHLSWWLDPNEPFIEQWNRLTPLLADQTPADLVVLMGDFNSDANVHGQSADVVKASGWFDTYEMAQTKDGGMTVGGLIDGWEDQPDQGAKRIDQVWVDRKTPVSSSRVVFNGTNEPVVSDHYGVLVELDR